MTKNDISTSDTGSGRKRKNSLATPEKQAAGFNRVRKAHKSEIAEDYVELIDDLIENQGEARIVDLAARLGVAHATVVNTVSRLQKDGLVRTEPYRSVFLTDAGQAMAAHARWRHRIVVAFLRAIGVSERTAELDAEGIEHHVSEETLRVFELIATNNLAEISQQ